MVCLSDAGTGRSTSDGLHGVKGFANWVQLKWFGSQAPVTFEGDTLDCRLVWKGRGVGVGMIPIDVLCDL